MNCLATRLPGAVPVLSFVTVGELEKWAEIRAWGARSRGALDRWISRRPVIGSDQTVSRIWGRLAAAARRRGDARSDNGLWVAACCLSEGLPLVNAQREDFIANSQGQAEPLYRIERAEHGVAVGDARLLLDLYGVPAAQREEVLGLVREARQRGWWQSYGDALPEPAAAYVGLEQDATSLAQYSAELVPGLLQTEDYARTPRAGLLADTDETTERWLAVRTQRQARLRGDQAFTCWAVLNEAVLRRTVGGVEVMHAYLQHLMQVAELPNVTLQVLAFDAGAHAAMDSSFTAIRFADQAAPDVIYIENATSVLYLEREAEVARVTPIFDHVHARAPWTQTGPCARSRRQPNGCHEGSEEKRRGMNTADLSRAQWRKSSYSANDNACVEVAHLDDGRVAVRDSKDQGHGPALIFSPPEWEAFARGMREGEFHPPSAT